MKTASASTSNRSGFALMMVLFTIVAMSLVLGSVMLWLSSSAKQSGENISFTTSKAAAEGATEMAFAQMDRDFLLSSLGSASAYTQFLPIMTNWPIQFVFSDTNGITNQISVNIGAASTGLQPLGAQYANLQGVTQTITVTATATPVGQLYNQPATVQQQFTFATVPAFQFAIFYNINMEIDPGAAMPIAGAVFSNGGIWTGGSNPTFSSTVEAAGQVNVTGTDPFLTTYTTTAIPTANFTDPGQPVSGINPLEIPIGASSNGTNNNQTNVIAVIQIPPASVAAPQSVAYLHTNQVYTYNQASIIVSNWSSGLFSATPCGNNFQVYLQDPWSGPSYYGPSSGHFNQLTNDFYIVTNTTGTGTNIVLGTIVTSNLFNLPGFTTNAIPNTSNPWGPRSNMDFVWTTGTGSHSTNWGVKYAGWTWLTNATFYDYRESDTVQAIQIVVSNLNTWLTTSSATGGSNWNESLIQDSGGGVCSIYAYNSVPLTTSQLPAVRVIGGALLSPNGFAIATPQPLYVAGDFNVRINGDSATSTLGSANMAHTYPASFLADAVTILSDSWSDSYNSSTSLTGSSGRTPTSTIVNAACLEGIVQSSTNYPSGGGADGYSGGVENFLRLLENWSTSTTLTYNGSILVMFPSQYATNFWQATGNYYNAPKRVWSFDTNFLQQALLPPLTPQFTVVIRTNWFGY